jgi:hypothetical protein
MKNFLITGLFLATLVACCPEVPEPFSNCVDQFVADNKLVKYTGQDLGCRTYVKLYELDLKAYFYTDCACADMLSIPVGCDGQQYCQSVDDAAMTYFLQNAEPKYVVGFYP